MINGAGGGVGTFAIQMAKSFGAEVTGVDRTVKLDMMRSLGADHVIDYTQENFTKNGKFYDLILLNELFESGKIKPVVDRCFPLSETAEAFQYFGEGHFKGKVVITVDHNNNTQQ